MAQQAMVYAQPMVQAGQPAPQQAMVYAQPMVQEGNPNVQVGQNQVSSGGSRAYQKKSKLNKIRYLQSKAYVSQYEKAMSLSSRNFRQVTRFLNKSRRPQRQNYF
jgi:hypothetical protein